MERYEQNAKLIRDLFNNEGTLESPIDLDISHMKIIELDPLEWIGIDITPRKLKITNTGFTGNIILCAKWQQGGPYLSRGPFEGNYMFAQVHFHWGENEMKGSEHTVDGASMPMELHVVHFKEEYETLESALRRPNGVTVLVYFCKLQDKPNEFMDGIVNNLALIRTAHSSVRITPLKLTNILRPFSQDYFLYWGSITTAHNIHNIFWIICREPIGISAKQIAEFRSLNDEKGMSILSNIRPVKGKQEKSVFHVSPSGSKYASLLPIPRDLLSSQIEEDGDTN
ncbi:carbonic anhydrase 1-like [Frieseomelitta varia]|nr:carbonic anhydrase 1-like [Frieseomelitta varia]